MLFPQKNYYLKYSLLFYPKAGFQITEGITHFFPISSAVRQEFLRWSERCYEAALLRRDALWAEAFQTRLFFGGLLVFIPVNISEAPKPFRIPMILPFPNYFDKIFPVGRGKFFSFPAL